MLRNWTQRVFAWLQHQGNHSPRRRRGSRRMFEGNRRGAMICHLEALESRRLLTNLVAVSVAGGAVNLTDISQRRVSTGDSFDVSYTSSQVVLTGHNGTAFVVGGQTLSTYTANVTGAISLTMSLNARGNSVAVAGDGTTDLSSFVVDLGGGRPGNSLSLTNVVADSVTVNGGRRDDAVTLDHCTINGDLNANLGRSAGDFLQLGSTTVKGNVSDTVSQLVMNQSILKGTLNDVQMRRNSTFNSTDTSYTGAASIQMGRSGIVNMLSSTSGMNQFGSSESVTGNRHRPTVINQQANAVVNTVPPTLQNAEIQGSPSVAPATITAPTVVSQSVSVSTPTITGTFDSVNGPNLTVAVNGKTYTLGTDSQLTSSTGNWSLNLTGAPLTALSNTVTVTSSDNAGHSKTGTGTITNQQASITSYLTANNLTATKTADGLAYVITTPGTGSLPTNGQTVKVQYTGHLINADGTVGAEFDSNTDGTDPSSPNPFPFVLGGTSVIAGWEEGFKFFPVGSVGKLLIPSALGYPNGSPPKIPAGSVLLFDVTVVSAT